MPLLIQPSIFFLMKFYTDGALILPSRQGMPFWSVKFGMRSTTPLFGGLPDRTNAKVRTPAGVHVFWGAFLSNQHRTAVVRPIGSIQDSNFHLDCVDFYPV